MHWLERMLVVAMLSVPSWAAAQAPARIPPAAPSSPPAPKTAPKTAAPAAPAPKAATPAPAAPPKAASPNAAAATPTPAAAPTSPAAATPAAAPPAGGDERERAKSLFERGVAAYEGGRHAEALANFQEAFRLRPHPLVRVNIANCYDKLGKPLEALFHFEQFLASDVATPAQRQEVVAATERLRKQLGSLALRVTPDGAIATIDGGEQRRTPILEPIQLPAGDHELELRLDGYQTTVRSFTLRGGATTEIEVVLEPASGAPAVAVVPAPEAATATPAQPTAAPEPAAPAAAARETEMAAASRDDGTLPTHVWVLGGLSAAMLASATITGILALGAQSDFDRYSMLRHDAQAPLAQQASYDDAIDAADRADTLALVTDVLLVGALATATAATIFAITDDGETAPPAEVTAALTPERAVLTLRASF